MNVGTVVFDRYQLHEQIGAGGAAVVWRATDELLHQRVALKRVTVSGLDDEQARLTRDRALREARLAAQLRGHPHVVAVYDVLVDDGDIWLVMEYLPARSLSKILDSDGPLDCGEVARIGAHIADALAAAHDCGIEHRDVKPGNVLIGDGGTVKLTDFGISHLTGDPRLTQTGISGTPAYLAPEVAARGESSPASDVFSLGATLYAAVEGQPPFGTDDNLLRLLNVVRTGIIRPPTMAGRLEPLLSRLLQVNPTTRPDAATTRDLLTDLATRPRDTTKDVHPQPGPSRPRWWPPPRRAALAAGALLALIAITTVIGLGAPAGNTGEPQSPPVPGPRIDAIDPVTQKRREADPCPLIDLDPLRQFGEPRFTISPWLHSCQATIRTTDGSETRLRVILSKPEEAAPGGTPEQVGGPTIDRKGRVRYENASACKHVLIWAD
ncbi:MAG: serine/threonine-protein kinase, partial [Pseudonocardiaceae bacterium]